MPDPEDQAHPPVIRKAVVGPSHLGLDAASLSGDKGAVAHATALLLAGQSFLDASRDKHLSLHLRAQLEEEGLRLLTAALGAAKRG